MATAYDGLADDISFSSALSIVSTTNTNPIQVTVSGSLPADFLTGVKVSIRHHALNTPANGVWTATVTGGATFTIPVAGLTPGGATGIVQPLNATPAYTYPADGDADNQASIAAWAQATGDRTQRLVLATGAYKLAGVGVAFLDAVTGTNLASALGAPFGAASWTAIDASPTLTGTVTFGCLSTLQSVPPYGFGGFAAGDMAVVRLHSGSSVSAGAGSSLARVGLWASLTLGDNFPTAFPGSGWGQLQAASQAIGLTTGIETGIAIEGRVSGLTTQNAIYVQPALFVLNSTSFSVSLLNDTQLIVECWRATGVPQ